jgi:chromosomal replication initiation ATPase DnaA
MGDRPRQIALDFAHVPSAAREDFVVTPSNRAALELIDRWPNGPVRGLALIGPEGSGKSHLAAVWSARTGAETWSGRLPENAGFAVVIEDVDRAPRDEAALFHLLNLASERDGALLFTMRTPVRAWGLLPDFVSRLGALPSASLAPPDDLLLTAVIAKQFADRQVAVPPDVIAYMVTRMDRSLATARRMVEMLDALSLAEGRAVTKPMVAEVLSADTPGGS